MSGYRYSDLPEGAIGLRLYKIVREELLACEPVYFTRGRPAVDTVLRRASIAGRVEWEGEIGDYYADVLIDEYGSWDGTVALDRQSYRALKNHWMRCKLEPRP